MWTENVTWFSNEEGKKGRIEAGQFADLIGSGPRLLLLRRDRDRRYDERPHCGRQTHRLCGRRLQGARRNRAPTGDAGLVAGA
jgi:hypothetical protein